MLSFLFVAFAAFSLVATCVVYRPPTQQATIALIGFIIGILTGELALFIIALQMLVTLLFVSCGAIQSGIGMLAMAALFLSWLGLAANAVTAMRSASRMQQALDDAGVTALAPLDHAELWRRLRRPFSIRLPGVRCQPGIVYDETHKLALDMYRGAGIAAGDQAPVLLYFHGGGLLEMGGTRRGQGLPLLNELADNGWVCLSIDYRLSPTHSWPAHLLDCKSALAWLREHIAEYGGDPNFVVVAGDSAGGQLAALMALTANEAEFQPGFEAVDTRVNAAICNYGVMDFCNLYGSAFNASTADIWSKQVVKAALDDPAAADRFASASAIAWAEKRAAHAPDMLLVHGDKDSLVGIQESRLLAEKLQQASENKVIFSPIDGAQHAFNVFRSLRGELALRQTLRFAQHCHRHYTGAYASSR